MTQQDLVQFLGRLQLGSRETITWPSGQSFEVSCYLTEIEPPPDLVTSVRAVVLRDPDEVLVVRDPTATHITPGGRVEHGETWLETLRREVGEETGWTVAQERRLGFICIHHLQPPPDGYKYPHPDFIHLVYVACAAGYVLELREQEGFEIDSGFRKVSDALALPLSAGDRLFLEAARASHKITS